MTDDPKIPFGFRRVFGQLQKGDGVWDGATFKRTKREPTTVIIKRTKMLYPCTDSGMVAIRRCDAEQTETPGTEGALSFD